MGLTAPRWGTFLLALVLGAGGIAARLGHLEWLAPISFGLLACGFLLLLVGVVLPRL